MPREKKILGEVVKTTAVIPSALHTAVGKRILDSHQTLAEAINAGLTLWLSQTGEDYSEEDYKARKNHRVDADAEPKEVLSRPEARLIAEFRRSSHEKRERMLSACATTEDLGPEMMPARSRAGKRKSG